MNLSIELIIGIDKWHNPFIVGYDKVIVELVLSEADLIEAFDNIDETPYIPGIYRAKFNLSTELYTTYFGIEKTEFVLKLSTLAPIHVWHNL